MRDDRGHFLAVGATLFSALRLYRSDRARLERDLRFLAEHGVDYVRILGTVGAPPVWAGREIDPRAASWASDLIGTVRLIGACGLRAQITVFGDAQVMAPTLPEKHAVIDEVGHVCRTERAAVIAVEVANESWQNGFPGAEGVAQLRALARRLRGQVDADLAVATSCPHGAGEHEQKASAHELYEGCPEANSTTEHYDRALGDGTWRPVRQPWQRQFYGIETPGAADNERIGIDESTIQPMPGFSGGPWPDRNPTDANPHRQVAGAVVAFMTGHWGYVLHDRSAGVYAQTEWSQVSTIGRILDGIRVIKALLPADLPNWTPQNNGHAGHPFQLVDHWVDGASSGVVRFYAATRDGRFIGCPFGIKREVTLQARWRLAMEAFDILAGAEAVALRELGPGQTVRLDDDPPVYLLRGERR